MGEETIRRALLAVFGLIVLVLAVLGAVTATQFKSQTSQIDKLSHAVEKITIKGLPLIVAIKDINLDIVQVQQYLSDVSATRAQNGRDEGLRQAQKSAEAFKQDIDLAKSLAEEIGKLETVAMLKEVEAAFTPYYEFGQSMAKAYIDHGPEIGNKMMPEFDGLAEELSEKLNIASWSVGELSSETVSELLDANNEVAASARILGLFLAVTATGLVLASAILIIFFRINRRATEELRIAAIAFDSQDGIFVCNAKNVFLRVNKAFCEISGYSAEEVIGKTPRLLKSSRHDDAFFKGMWDSLQENGSWEGEIWNRRKSGEAFPARLCISSAKDGSGKITHYIGTMTDISQRKEAEEEITHLAFYDTLTGLPNRRLFLDRLKQATATSARTASHGALFFIDLDHFKTLNDTRGHDKGDLLLKQVAQRITENIREGDSVARLGGDEFVVMLEDLSGEIEEAASAAEAVGEKILASLGRAFDLDGLEYHSSSSIGVSLFIGHQKTVDELLKQSDIAMYQAKKDGRNTLRFFDPYTQAMVMGQAALEADLRQGVLEDQFILFYQVQVGEQGQQTGAEVLLRWCHPLRGMVPPGDFILLAEETGLIVRLGYWVLKRACEQLVAWAANPKTAHLSLAVNVSARQFHHKDFVAQLEAVLDVSGADPRKLKLELTESLLVTNVDDVIAKMSALKARGVSFSLDDFGTGYSSLTYLKRLPLDQLKIDQSFVRDVLIDPNDTAIARTIVALGQSLGLTVIAEGVETIEQRLLLAELGCHSYQGYFFGRPVPLAEFEQSLGKEWGDGK
ncbi:MAG: EAL domain-containing protein [Alphaproteobacteria bacterium]|nr:EAL domain-containing protein [Alphaproteobacteria bacterium]